MNTAELIAQVRQAATLEDESTEFTDAEITRVMNQTMGSVFEPLIAQQRAGYWLHTLTRTLGTGNPYVRLHPRACALEQIDIRQGSNDWQPLTGVPVVWSSTVPLTLMVRAAVSTATTRPDVC